MSPVNGKVYEFKTVEVIYAVRATETVVITVMVYYSDGKQEGRQ